MPNFRPYSFGGPYVPTHQGWPTQSRVPYGLNYEGSSGYWGGPPVPGQQPGDRGRRAVDEIRGVQEWLASRGAYPGTYTGNNGPPEFGVTKTVKQPEIAGAVNQALAAEQATASQAAKGFQDFLKEAQDKSQAAFNAEQAALQTGGSEAELRGINRGYEATQRGITGDVAARNKAYETAQAGQAADVETRNRDYAAETAATLARLTAANEAEAGAQRAVADRTIAAARGRNAAFQAVGSAAGAPNAMSGAATNRDVATIRDILVPTEARIAERRYSQIANIERPWQRELLGNDQALNTLRQSQAREAYGNDQALFGRRSALESDFANRAGDTVRYIDDLKRRSATRLTNLQLQLLDDAQRRLMAGEQLSGAHIANLRQIQAADLDANWYTVNTPFNPATVPATPYFSPGYPARNYTPQGSYPVAAPTTSSGTAYAPSPPSYAPPGAVLPAWANRTAADPGGLSPGEIAAVYGNPNLAPPPSQRFLDDQDQTALEDWFFRDRG